MEDNCTAELATGSSGNNPTASAAFTKAAHSDVSTLIIKHPVLRAGCVVQVAVNVDRRGQVGGEKYMTAGRLFGGRLSCPGVV